MQQLKKDYYRLFLQRIQVKQKTIEQVEAAKLQEKGEIFLRSWTEEDLSIELAKSGSMISDYQAEEIGKYDGSPDAQLALAFNDGFVEGGGTQSRQLFKETPFESSNSQRAIETHEWEAPQQESFDPNNNLGEFVQSHREDGLEQLLFNDPVKSEGMSQRSSNLRKTSVHQVYSSQEHSARQHNNDDGEVSDDVDGRYKSNPQLQNDDKQFPQLPQVEEVSEVLVVEEQNGENAYFNKLQDFGVSPIMSGASQNFKGPPNKLLTVTQDVVARQQTSQQPSTINKKGHQRGHESSSFRTDSDMRNYDDQNDPEAGPAQYPQEEILECEGSQSSQTENQDLPTSLFGAPTPIEIPSDRVSEELKQEPPKEESSYEYEYGEEEDEEEEKAPSGAHLIEEHDDHDMGRQDSQMPLNEEEKREFSLREDEEMKDDDDKNHIILKTIKGNAQIQRKRAKIGAKPDEDLIPTTIGGIPPSRSASPDFATDNNLTPQMTTIEVPRFSRQQMRQLATCTFNDWYFDRTHSWDYNDYLNCKALPTLEEELGPYLADIESNIITLGNLPFIDLGDKPSTYGPNKDEADQIFTIPKCQYPNKVIVKYSYCKSIYVSSTQSLQKKFKKAKFGERGLLFEDFQEAMLYATRHEVSYRAWGQFWDKINLGYLLAGLLATVVTCLLQAMYLSWAYCVVTVLAYIIYTIECKLCIIVNKITRYFGNKQPQL